MSDIGHSSTRSIMPDDWFGGGDGSIFPERYSLIEYPLIEREESIFMFFTKKLLFRSCHTKYLSSTPADIVEFFTIKMVGNISFVVLARMMTIHQEYYGSEENPTRNDRKNNTLEHKLGLRI